MIERIEKLFKNLSETEKSLAERLSTDQVNTDILDEWNRVRLMKETLRWLTGTSNYSIQELAQGGIEVGVSQL